jgi:hypothetical protein
MHPCHNKPRPSASNTYWAQDGWFYHDAGMTRKPKMIRISTDFDYRCKREDRATDPLCAGCVHIGSGE